MATLPTGLQGASDSALIEAVRDGSTDAYAQLYERHVDAAFNMARTVTRSTPDADDLVADAFARVLDMLRAGRGPTDAFRAYLLTTIRHSAYDRTRRTRERPAEDIGELAGAELSEPFTDTTLAALERSLVTRAFQRLPERWQAALWYVVIEQQQPADVAGFFGLTPNGVSALVYRAREGLRQEYLQVHLGQLDTEGGSVRCRSTVKRLGAWTRGKLAKRETAQVETHLDHCERCHALSAELLAINGALRGTLPPVLLGIAVTSGYFATVSGSGNAAAGLTAGASAGAGAAGTAGSTGDAITAVPRQTATAAVSTGGLLAAMGIALATGTGSAPPQPSAAPPPPPVVQQPPDSPEQPPPEPPTPDPPPRETPPPPSEAPATPPPPPPEEPDLVGTGPAEPVRMVAGGDPADVPITVRNDGSAPSGPVTVTLELPAGVSAELPEAGPEAGPASGPETGSEAEPATDQPAEGAEADTQPASTAPAAVDVRQQRASTPAKTPEVRCADSETELRCSTARGLDPGEFVEFDFQISAEHEHTDGELAARIGSGGDLAASLPPVPVLVAPTPPRENVEVRLDAWDHVPWLNSRASLRMRNTGKSSGQAEAVLRLPEEARAIGLPSECDHEADPREIRCDTELAPGETFTGQVWLRTSPHSASWWPPMPETRTHMKHHLGPEVSLTVRARLNDALDEDATTTRLWGLGWPFPAEPKPPTTSSPPTTSAPPTTSTPPPGTGTSPSETPPVPTLEPTTPEPTKPDRPSTTPPPGQSEPGTTPPSGTSPSAPSSGETPSGETPSSPVPPTTGTTSSARPSSTTPAPTDTSRPPESSVPEQPSDSKLPGTPDPSTAPRPTEDPPAGSTEPSVERPPEDHPSPEETGSEQHDSGEPDAPRTAPGATTGGS